ncbi:MAG: YhcH/YjgK/YiaL family protein [Bacteroidales bacterium]|nr:YhcH/YjgK/YiaL family protein [Bacteroidales bacterium]
MIVSNLDDAARYGAISERIALAIDWLKANTGNYPEPGTSVGIGMGVIVKSESPMLVNREMARLEAHRKYIDIHVPVKGNETIGWAPVADLVHALAPYDDDRDIAFYGDSARSLLHLRPGQIAVFFPEDAHAPNIGIGLHTKLCVKIPCL